MQWLTAANPLAAALRGVLLPVVTSALVVLGLDPSCAARVGEVVLRPFGL